MYKGRKHKHKLEAKNKSAQQMNCYMVQNIQTELEIYLKR